MDTDALYMNSSTNNPPLRQTEKRFLDNSKIDKIRF